MSNPADTGHPVEDLIRRRWSPVGFAGRPVEPWKIRSVLEAARWAASSYNEQPWKFLLATRDEPEAFRRFVDCLVEGNVPWASRAPVLMLSVAGLQFARNAKPNRHALHDVGLAVGNLSLQATALDLYVHQMAGFSVDKARRNFNIPDDHEPAAMIAVGYLDDPQSVPEPLAQRDAAPRSRKPLSEFVFAARWGDPSPLVKDDG